MAAETPLTRRIAARALTIYVALGIVLLPVVLWQQMGLKWLCGLTFSWICIAVVLCNFAFDFRGSIDGGGNGGSGGGGRRRIAVSREHLRLMLTDRDFDADDYEQLMALESRNVAKNLGATEAEISRLPTWAWTAGQRSSAASLEERSCPICLEEFEIGESIRALPCLHKFHPHCVATWLRSNAVCPVCKLPGIG